MKTLEQSQDEDQYDLDEDNGFGVNEEGSVHAGPVHELERAHEKMNQGEPRLGKRDPLQAAEQMSNQSGQGEGGAARLPGSKAIKNNVLNLKPASAEWIANFRLQEKDRYRHPTLPWSYKLEAGGQ